MTKTQPATGDVKGNELIFSGQYSVLGVMLWCIERFNPNAEGSFLICDANNEVVPKEVFQEFQASLRDTVTKFEKRILG